MKKLKRIIFVLLVVFLAIFLGLNVLVLAIGKTLLSNNLSNILGRDVEVGLLYISPPYSLSVNNLIIKELLNVEKIKIQPSISGLFLGKLVLNQFFVINPQLSVVRISETKFNFSEVIDKLKLNQSKSNLFIKEAVIKNGNISFRDKLTQSSFEITPLDFSAITSLLDFKTRLNLDAQVISGNRKNIGRINLDGWMNFLKKDMQAKFSIKDLDIAYFSGLFENSFSRKIEFGTLFFNANLNSKDNDLIIDCHIETRNLSFSGGEALIFDTSKRDVTIFNNLSGVVLNTLIGPGSGGIFDFSIHTKFDNPKLEGLRFKGNIFKEPIKNIIENPKETIEQFKKTGEDFEKIGKELKEQFKDIKDIFKIKKEESQETTSQEANGK